MAPLIIIVSFTAICIGYFLLRSRDHKLLLKLMPEVREALRDYESITSNDFYFDEYQFDWFKETYKGLYTRLPNRNYTVLRKNEVLAAKEFKDVYHHLRSRKDAYNRDFIKNESAKYWDFFSALDENPLAQDQIEAIVSDEKTNLIVAGAGTGKTTTIAGKVGYILEKGLAKPEEILVVSFTNAAVREMRDRIGRYCAGHNDLDNIKVKTFNGFGFEITRKVLNDPNIQTAFKNEEELYFFIKTSFDDLFLSNEDFRKKATNFLAFFSRPPRNEFDYPNAEEYNRNEQSYKNRSLDGKILKSKEEVEISNFLFLNGIKYEYEKVYPIRNEDADLNRGAYQPDFYLSDYEIWIEHFGIDRDGNVSPRFSGTAERSAKEVYHEGIKWKRDIHAKYETNLVETYSFENSKGVLISRLKRKLADRGVQFRTLSPEEILKSIKHPEIFDGFVKLLATFLNLLKSNNVRPNQISEANRSDKRLNVFLDVFKEIYVRYEKDLSDKSSLDFNDMINRATEGIRQNRYRSRFKYILVDEFQDMSLGRYKLLAALREQSPGTKLYCVGDDWQSIYRFAGSDISIITQFEKYFGFTRLSQILNTYRFNQEILKVSTDFIEKNKAQLRKKLKSSFEASEPSFRLCPLNLSNLNYDNRRARIRDKVCWIVDAVNRKSDKPQTVFIIGRYHFINPNLPHTIGNVNVHYYTAHSVKGLTCDISIIVEINSGVFGFPSEVDDDPILEYLLNEEDHYENAEERRLFYVALTRARNKNYLLFDAENESKFITELRTQLKTQDLVVR